MVFKIFQSSAFVLGAFSDTQRKWILIWREQSHIHQDYTVYNFLLSVSHLSCPYQSTLYIDGFPNHLGNKTKALPWSSSILRFSLQGSWVQFLVGTKWPASCGGMVTYNNENPNCFRLLTPWIRTAEYVSFMVKFLPDFFNMFLYIFQHMIVLYYSESEVTQSSPTLCDPVDCGLPGSSFCRILQAGILEWVAYLLQGIFLTKEWNMALHCRQAFYPLSHQGTPILYWCCNAF